MLTRSHYNRWPGVHRLDAARLYRLALEKGSAGARSHGIADEGAPTRDIAEVIGRRLNLPVVAKSPAEAADRFGLLGLFFGSDIPASSERTRGLLGWQPKRPGSSPISISRIISGRNRSPPEWRRPEGRRLAAQAPGTRALR